MSSKQIRKRSDTISHSLKVNEKIMESKFLLLSRVDTDTCQPPPRCEMREDFKIIYKRHDFRIR